MRRKEFKGIVTEVEQTPRVLTSTNTKPLKEEVAVLTPVSSSSVLKGRFVEGFKFVENENEISLTPPSAGPGRLWLYKDPLNTDAVKLPAYRKKPLEVKEGQKVSVSFEISNLEGAGQALIVLMGSANNQLKYVIIQKSGKISLDYTVEKGIVALTPMFIATGKSFSFKDLQFSISN